jgi:hypothetical protein
MKKTMILLFAVLLVLMCPKPSLGQEQTTTQKELSVEEQTQILDSEIERSNALIGDVDAAIAIYQQQRTALINKRAELKALRVRLHPAAAGGTYANKSMSDTGDMVLGTAGAVAAAATGNYVGAAVMESRVVNQGLDTAIRKVDEQNARIEEKLKEQREWKAEHPGNNKK